MAPTLAPYNNAMRLGQGFNSYTQQICLEDAVTPPSFADRRQLRSQNEEGVSQIVSFSSRFVDKLSDVTDAMNISASLSIKTSTVGGKASGSFVDSDKFKESDLNFFIQVKVTNQTQLAENYTEFVKLSKLNSAKLTEIYGDSFICGFEEGGELNALISVKVSDKQKTFAVKAELEASLGTPALSGEVKGKVDIEKSSINTSTETTVTVNWSGGGQIKETNVLWDINSLTLAAANFPDMVARTPQRTYAILKKYTALKSFHEQMGDISPLEYENAGIYTSALMDSYMDYKSLWKQIQIANFELQNQRADMIESKVPKEVLALEPPPSSTDSNDINPVVSPTSSSAQLAVAALAGAGEQLPAPPNASTSEPASQAVTTQQNVPTTDPPVAHKHKFIPNTIEYKPYPATTLGLERARRDCRMEMIKIVNEVDEVTLEPTLALDANRDKLFVSPRVFKQLLPVVTLRPLGDASALSTAFPRNPVILGVAGEETAPSLWIVDKTVPGEPYPAAQASAEKHKSKGRLFSMGRSWYGTTVPVTLDTFFNDLDLIDSTWSPVSFTVWDNGSRMTGIKTVYSNGREIAHGLCIGSSGIKLELSDNGSSRIIAVGGGYSMLEEIWTVDQFRLPSFWSPPSGFYSLRGFWGTLRTDYSGFSTLGCLWGKDTPQSLTKPAETAAQGDDSTPQAELYKNPSTLPLNIQGSISKHKDKAGFYRMGEFGGDKREDLTGTFFNHLDTIEKTWRIRIIFTCAGQGTDGFSTLRGLKVVYTNGRELVAGNFDDDDVQKEETTLTDFFTVALKIKSSQKESGYVNRYIDALYTYKVPTSSSSAGTQPWDITTKYHGYQSSYYEMVNVFDKVDDVNTWSLRGFYGQSDSKGLSRLGAIWGCG